jgi:cytochrome c peroxidase
MINLIRSFAMIVMLAGAWPVPALAADPAPTMADLKALYRRPTSIPFPPENPYGDAKAKLGRILFFDPIMSGPRTIACSSCHNPGLSWTDGQTVANGVGRMKLHTPTIIDVAWVPILGWDGKFPNLESVAFGPLISPINMNNTEANILDRLTRIPAYAAAFAEAFPGTNPEEAVTRPHIEQALATFERTIVAAKAPFDRWVDGDDTAISPAAKRGFVLFNGKAGCANCHKGPSFTDSSFHDIGFASEEDVGRGRLFPATVKLNHAFKVPTLRDVARRPPYMHDGAVPTLEAVVAVYNGGGIDRPSRSDLIRPLGLTAAEQQDLIAFLQTLTGEPTPIEVPVLPR